LLNFNFFSRSGTKKFDDPSKAKKKQTLVFSEEQNELKQLLLDLIQKLKGHISKEVEVIEGHIDKNVKGIGKSASDKDNQFSMLIKETGDPLTDVFLLNIIQLYTKLIKFDMLRVFDKQEYFYSSVQNFVRVLEYDPRNPAYSYVLEE